MARVPLKLSGASDQAATGAGPEAEDFISSAWDGGQQPCSLQHEECSSHVYQRQ